MGLRKFARSILGRSSRDRFLLHHGFYEGVLGTSLELHLRCSGSRSGELAEAAILGEIDRLTKIFSIFTPESELRRWEEGGCEPAPISPELAGALIAAEEWFRRTGGAFDPCVGRLTDADLEAHRGRSPRSAPAGSPTEGLEPRLWEVESGPDGGFRARKWTPLPIDLNAIAKGIILDRAAAVALESEGIEEVLINIGGDLRHRGPGPARIGITDPFVDAENAPPLATLLIQDEAVATSGSYRRRRIRGAQSESHIVDARPGRESARIRSASVIAATAQAADALATSFNVLLPGEGIALADTLPGVACLIVEESGARYTNREWDRRAPDRAGPSALQEPK